MPTRIITHIALLVSLTVLSPLQATAQNYFSHIRDLQNKITLGSTEPDFNVFVISTEMIIGRARPIIEKAPQGLYVTVGSERGFRGASMAPNTTHLLLLDISPAIIRFNRINTELLKAPNLSEYKRLRWTSSAEEWTQFKNKLKKHSFKVGLNEDDFTWWEQNVRDLKNFTYPIPELLNHFGRDTFVDQFHAINKRMKEKEDLTPEESAWWKKHLGTSEKPGYIAPWVKDGTTAIDMGSVIDFKSGNYLYDEKLYNNLHSLAIKDRIASIRMNLSDQDHVSQLVKSITRSKLKLSVLDLDNSFYEAYLGQKVYRTLVESFLAVGQPQSILMMMQNYKNFGSSQFQTYIGFRFSNVKKWPEKFLIQDFFSTLPEDLLDLISGRLYEEWEMPPLNYLEKLN